MLGNISKHSSKGSSQFEQEESFPQKESLKSLWREEIVPARRDRVISKRKLGW